MPNDPDPRIDDNEGQIPPMLQGDELDRVLHQVQVNLQQQPLGLNNNPMFNQGFVQPMIPAPGNLNSCYPDNVPCLSNRATN